MDTARRKKAPFKKASVHSEFEIVKEYSQEFYKSIKPPRAK